MTLQHRCHCVGCDTRGMCLLEPMRKADSMTLQQAMIELGKKIPIADDTVKARLDRAYDIVRQNGSGYAITKSNSTVNAFADGYVWHIHKASTAPSFSSDDSSAFYTVDSQGCSCPDAQDRARAGLCKHRLATMLMLEMEKNDDAL